jgi:hypothetical protein
MPRGLNDFLHEGFLVLEIGLKLKNVFVATGIFVTITFLAFPAKSRLEQTMLSENSLYSLWLIWEIWMVGQEDQQLGYFLAIVHKPSVLYPSLFSTQLDIHS